MKDSAYTRHSAPVQDSVPTPSTRPQRSRLWIGAVVSILIGVLMLPTVFLIGLGISLIVLGVLMGITAFVMEQKRRRAVTVAEDKETPPPNIVP